MTKRSAISAPKPNPWSGLLASLVILLLVVGYMIVDDCSKSWDEYVHTIYA